MRAEARIFEIVVGFCFVMAIVYGTWTKLATGSIEVVGTVGLTLTGGLALIVSTYFQFVARRIRSRPEDDTEAEVADGAGEMGFFSPGSYWPIGLAGAGACGAVAFAFFQSWMIVLAVITILFMVGGLVFEYHLGPNKE